ncbi:hypothetical protein C8J57DRAFT_1268106 [Mycena rebaudengoi]|nr:hypothetical protein C8J57DRAFT_1268106 [Mycena rebaudengoi]
MNLRPNLVYITTSSLFSVFGLATSPSFIPLVLTLATILVYAPLLFHRPHTFGYTALLWSCITVCSSIGRLIPSVNALSTAGTSVAVLLSISAITSAIAIFAVAIDVYMCARFGLIQEFIFPTIWVSLWAALSRLPLGRLITWSPVLVGTPGIDWIVAAWAVLISQSIGTWYMAGSHDDDIKEFFLADPAQLKKISLAVVLTALTIPSFIVSTSPSPINPPKTNTLLSVGCALPPFYSYDHTSPTLDDYITESKKLQAKVILWPEAAVTFRSEGERETAFTKIRESIGKKGTYWAASFEEEIGDDKMSLKRTGVAILSNYSSDEPFVYYKRNLVPIAESFPLSRGLDPPSIYTFELSQPKGVPKVDWDHPRPITLTASICLDFATPSPFRDLDSRPALILAPARTWDAEIGHRMWEESKQRANEIGSLVLWCDGGKGGVSGVAGAGYNSPYQVGEGSWSKFIGLPYPFDSTPTLYARFGDTLVVGVSWLFVLVALGLPSVIHYRTTTRYLHAAGKKSIDWVKRRSTRPRTESNLIDFGGD